MFILGTCPKAGAAGDQIFSEGEDSVAVGEANARVTVSPKRAVGWEHWFHISSGEVTFSPLPLTSGSKQRGKKTKIQSSKKYQFFVSSHLAQGL